MTEEKFVSAVIVAAGNASRMNKDKIILPIGGIPCICRTLWLLKKPRPLRK